MPALSIRNLTTLGLESLTFSRLIGPKPPPGLTSGGPPPVLELIDYSTLPGTILQEETGQIRPLELGTRSKRGWSDDRVAQVETDSFPFSAVGLIATPGGTCTGFLVGPRHVATAAHCYKHGREMVFAPGFNNGSAVHGAYNVTTVLRPYQKPTCKDRPGKLCEGTGWSPCDWAHDYMILVLGENDRIGERTGFFEVGAVYQDLVSPEMEFSARYQSAGYPADMPEVGELPTMYQQKGIRALRKNTLNCEQSGYGPLVTNADAYYGQSGSPVWLNLANGARAYGVMSGWVEVPGDENITTIANMRFKDAVEKARLKYP